MIKTIQYWPIIMKNNLKSNNMYASIIEKGIRQINYFNFT